MRTTAYYYQYFCQKKKKKKKHLELCSVFNVKVTPLIRPLLDLTKGDLSSRSLLYF